MVRFTATGQPFDLLVDPQLIEFIYGTINGDLRHPQTGLSRIVGGMSLERLPYGGTGKYTVVLHAPTDRKWHFFGDSTVVLHQDTIGSPSPPSTGSETN